MHYLLILKEKSNSANDASINLVRIHSKTSNLHIHNTFTQFFGRYTLLNKNNRILKSLYRVVFNNVTKAQWPKALNSFKSVSEQIFISGILFIQCREEDKFIIPFLYLVPHAT